MSNVKRSEEQLKELGIVTTYVVAGFKDGSFVILDANSKRMAYSKGSRYKPLPLCYSYSKVKYPTYEAAFNAIRESVLFKKHDVVQFQTRDGRPEGLSGKGIITEKHPDHFIVAHPYIVQDGPHKGEFFVSQVYCLPEELSRPTYNTWGFYFRYLPDTDFLGPYQTKEEMNRVKDEFSLWAIGMACAQVAGKETSK